MDCVIRRATDADAAAISIIVETALCESNAQDYSAEIIDQVVQNFSPAQILRFLTLRQVYVASVGGDVVGTGSLDGNTVRSVFVHPVWQGRGIGHRLMKTIESEAMRGGVERLRVPSSITAQGFYRSLGFVKVRDEFHGEERTIIMEKIVGS
ncbi:GNAT family N-acetyltransferase [Pseudomonas sp. Bc-h]|jgi:N-acetylglutamate synthase-like GNAT family acetyltransferase|uniref:GNAT family N-acetyltransferase n=1 Tax=Pseudomonas sp. Bc-h TaxID=1943632 RepID=UPI0009D9F88D|nr:GNAT family N-acetyltransferase [Pseudomonas sp. Bc-h]OQR31819.1 GNAT family N-acetyltransferase [Pseudomonas sp. Bc-h]